MENKNLAQCVDRSLPSNQVGATALGALYVLVTLGLIVLFLVYSVPVYMTAYSVAGVLQGAAQDPGLSGASKRAIHRSVKKRLTTSYVENVSADDLTIKSVPEGRLLQIKYSVDRPFLFNVGIHYEFDKRAILPKADDE